ncbi:MULTISPECIES: type IV toxin-antitoxin system AbiEi family antitoxin domain-containing protein [unclassified Frondihabitans]|uniref:type IV toxin-antitoxin system AbiEi family antitoxin domain-containing protein n=1 Tax=unclassified Frondihabitans TaxID=2626248 RepID=UPI000F503CEA|nr:MULTISPECIES: type IV toxin-antitoxin system AbiEi family antitoxin domain-containing protein [unclassified Frondihabitans]RPE77870.1 hypothetical protein EDF37_0535 [Frondihabitans sp. PhB153]RPF08149.1 hypothetical protein EDF39_0536 [Frondihabitans sp. PhB161]
MSVFEWIYEAESLDGRLTRLAASTHGIFTSEQAGRVGLTPEYLRRKVTDQVVEVVDERSIYRHLASEAPWYESFYRAEWASIHPAQFADERTRSYRQPRDVITGQWALSMQGFFPFYPRGLFLFSEPTSTSSACIDVVVHPIQPEDWTWTAGLPVARPATAIADMVLAQDDEDAIRDNLQEAVRQGDFDLRRFSEIVEASAFRNPAIAESGAETFGRLFGTGNTWITRDDVVTSTAFDGRDITVTSTYPSIERP